MNSVNSLSKKRVCFTIAAPLAPDFVASYLARPTKSEKSCSRFSALSLDLWTPASLRGGLISTLSKLLRAILSMMDDKMASLFSKSGASACPLSSFRAAF